MNEDIIEKAHGVKYPSSGDSRGSTRVHHLRRPYYLGPFESPQSYIMFGLWKHHLLETGVAPETKKIRKTVAGLLDTDDLAEDPNTSMRQSLASIFDRAAIPGIAVALFCGMLFGFGISSIFSKPIDESKNGFSAVPTTPSELDSDSQRPVVDGIKLNDSEYESFQEFVRGLRIASDLHEKKLRQRTKRNPAMDGETLEDVFNILKDGNRNALHKTRISAMGQSR